eukprot:gene12067-16098_t
MPSSRSDITLAAIGFMAALVVPFAAHALQSTATGRISVGQVMEMIEKAGTSPIARQTLVAYVAGVGEAAGVIVDTIGNGSRTVSCQKSFSLDTGAVRAALEAGAPHQDSWSQTPATPLIVADMVKRAALQCQGRSRRGNPAAFSFTTARHAARLAIWLSKGSEKTMSKKTWAAVDDYIVDALFEADPALDAVLVANRDQGLPPIDV